MNFLIFQNFWDFILIFQDSFNRAGPAEVTWHDVGGNMARPCKPIWMPTWCLRGVNSDIKWSGLNRAIRQSGLNRAIGRLKSHGVESASWATMPRITRDPTDEITQSEIRVMSHQFHAIRRRNHTELNPLRGPRSTNFAQTSL